MNDSEIIEWMQANKDDHTTATSLAEEALIAFEDEIYTDEEEEVFFELAAEIMTEER